MARPRTRMQKSRILNTAVALAPGNSNITGQDQLEGGDEECQIKRIVLSASSADPIFVQFALADEQFAAIGDFTENRLVYSFTSTGPMIINETTTIRVPRGHYLGILLTASAANPGPVDANVCLQLNYLVLS